MGANSSKQQETSSTDDTSLNLPIASEIAIADPRVFRTMSLFLKPDNLMILSRVSKQFHELAGDDEIWRPKLSKYFPKKEDFITAAREMGVSDKEIFIHLHRMQKEDKIQKEGLNARNELLVIATKYAGIAQLKKMGLTYSELHTLIGESKFSIDSVAREQKNQELFNYFYKLSESFVHNSSKNTQTNRLVETKFGVKWSLLHYAAEYNQDTKVFAALLAQDGADVNQPADNGATALHIASENGNLAAIQALVDAGADINIAMIQRWQMDGRTPLILAASRGQADAVNALLAAKADVNKAAQDDSTALFYAIEARQTNIVSILIRAGANVNQIASNYRHSTALFFAIYMREFESVKLLVAAGADVNIVDGEGFTPLVHAAARKNPDMVRYLLQHDAKPGITMTSCNKHLFDYIEEQQDDIDISSFVLC